MKIRHDLREYGAMKILAKGNEVERGYGHVSRDLGKKDLKG